MFTVFYTGAPDGLADIELSPSQFTHRSSETTVTGVVHLVDVDGVLDDINARPNGQLVIKHDGVEIFHSTANTIRQDTGGKSSSITVEGTKAVVTGSATFTAENVSYIRATDTVTVRCDYFPALVPGDTLNYPGGSIVADRFALFVGPGSLQFEVGGV